MGNFGGHALPGSFFIVFGLWWVTQMYSHYYKAQRKKMEFTSTAIFPVPCLCRRIRHWPIEAVVKIVCTSLGAVLELIWGYENHHMHSGNGQHATMFGYFGVTGIIDVLLFFKCRLPPHMDYISYAMALTCEGLLFKFHLHGDKELNVVLHTLLIYVVWANILAVILEAVFRHSIVFALARAYCIILQGTWFLQVGWIIYPPFKGSWKWDQESHEQVMLATLIFAWHAMACFLLVLAIGRVVLFFQRCCGAREEADMMAMERLIQDGGGEQTALYVGVSGENDDDLE